jgi:DNA-directed RNA polymerase specialized sigma24 family protein
VLTLKYGFDFSNADVAAILGKTEGAVKALQHRAFATLQRSLTAAQTS